VMLDMQKAYIILLQLIDNAIKFTTDGTITIRFRWHQAQKAIEIAVEDTGIGISEEKISLIFQPFMQLESGYTRPFEGTGLGLTLVEKLVHRMGGTIQVVSTPGKGSVFRIVLPCEPIQEAER